MATTEIHAITQTVGASLAYIMSDKVEVVLKDDVADSIAYVMNDKTGEVTYITLTSTLNCFNPSNPVEDFYALMHTYGRREITHGNARSKGGNAIVAWHLIQSFEGQVDPVIANEIGNKLAQELFPNHPVVISTHTNTENTHNHIEFCAWNLDGKKYNYDHAAYQIIRETSDRLCDEYGLSVLEHTRDRKLVKWQDVDGQTHYYEPTDRKNELIQKRKEGELTNDDVNSYRNTVQYDIGEAKKQTNVEIVKQAIDSKLPYATSYEHLLFMLREIGFRIKDKKKNGEWLAHITFIPPTADKGVRDYKIDEFGYYIRENLTAIIAEQNKALGREEETLLQLNVPYYDEYVYGEIDVQNINEDYRAEVSEYGEYKIVKRGEPEKDIIRDVKKSDRELYGLYDTSQIDRLIAEQREARKYKKQPQKREEILVQQIQEGFENLRFMERKQIYSYQQINETVKGLWEQHNACLVKIGEAERMIDRLENVSRAPQILKETKARMEQGKDNPEYIMEQYPKDARLAKVCVEDMKKYNVSDIESLKSLQVSIQKYREQVNSLQGMLTVFSKELSEYNRCVTTLARIDKEQGRDKNELFVSYENITRNSKREAERTEQKKQKGKDR